MSQDLIAGLVSSFGGPVLEKLGAKLGLPKQTVEKLVPMAIGLIVTALARKAKTTEGQGQIGQLLGAAGQLGISTDNLASFVGGVDSTEATGLLQGLLGKDALSNVVGNVSRKSGISAEQASSLLATAAPVVLGQVGAMQQSAGLDSAGLAKMIGEGAGGLANLKDMDYILDDVPGVGDDIKRTIKKIFG